MTRTILIGDIHGCYLELLDLFERVGLTDDDQVLSVGDLVDRGPGSPQVLRWFMEHDNAHAICGNHERKHVRGVFSYSQDIARLQLGSDYAEAVAWMATLPYYVETEQVRVVHGGLIPGTPLADTPEDVLAATTSGTRKLEQLLGGARWWERYTDEVPVVFGHHVVGEEPLVVDDRVFGIDTGACHGMRLTALVLPSFELVSVPARADHWAEVRTQWQLPVLRDIAWPEQSFASIRRKLERNRRATDPDVRRFLAEIEAWSQELRDAVPTLHAAIDAQLLALKEAHGDDFRRAAAGLPHGRTLLARASGRSTESLAAASPTAVLALARALDVDLSDRVRAYPPAC
ncbi:MAG: serine/threonine protein phosphatase [Myxococcales bacterium]|nr:serine/threonine protein phosphatase [Myxococcales bacterium]